MRRQQHEVTKREVAEKQLAAAAAAKRQAALKALAEKQKEVRLVDETRATLQQSSHCYSFSCAMRAVAVATNQVVEQSQPQSPTP